MGFKVGNLDFEKKENGVFISHNLTGEGNLITNDEWISVITELSYKPENAEQHEAAEKFHKGNDGE
jgi:hypothetical protein